MPSSRTFSLSIASLLLAAGCGAGTEPAGVAPPPTGGPATSASAPPAGTASTAAAPKDGPPVAARRPVVDEYHGVKVTDDYQWLEKAGDPEVVAWSDGQNRYTRKVLDALPERAPLKAKIAGLLGATPPDRAGFIRRAGTLFGIKEQPPKQQAFLISLASPDDTGSERVIVDPNQIDPSGKTTIDFFVPSLDGKKVAVSLSVGGSENGTVHVYDAVTGKEQGDTIAHVNGGTAGGSLSWNKDGTGFYYTRYPRPGERPEADLDFYQQVYFHKLGKSEKDDTYEIGKDFPRIAEVELKTSNDGKYVLASVQNGDGGEYDHYLLTGPSKWEKIAGYADKVASAHFGPDGSVYLRSLNGSPKGKILRLLPGVSALAKATTIVPESDGVIEGFEVTASRVYVNALAGGPSELRAYDLKGKAQPPVAIPPISSVRELVALDGDDLFFRNTSFTEPPGWYVVTGKSGKVHKTALYQTSPADFSDVEALREMCTSKDGTKVPMNILRKKGTPLDKNRPVVLSGYGGYNVTIKPGFSPLSRVMLDAGGVIVRTNLRGGGEFGEEWHRGGNLTNKQNVFDDFAACAKRLFELGYTSPSRLAIIGGSNGGLLMGAELTQHPEMFRAVVSYVGIYDSLRVELTPNGAFNVTEFGTVKNPDHFKALLAYSPFHNVKDGVAYPSALFLTGANDPRVDPFHSRKMVARLQAANGGPHPILLRTSGDTGHGIGSPLSAEIEENADVEAFLFHELGIPVEAPAAK
ncbi:MAG: prolyl oligopeptidase family serine peptidase [Byssovorax sp.]